MSGLVRPDPIRWAAGIDPAYVMEWGREGIEYHPPYCAKRDGRWAVYEAWRLLRGPNPGACQYEWRWLRWWHPRDVLLLARDRRRAWREYGGPLDLFWLRHPGAALLSMATLLVIVSVIATLGFTRGW